MSNNKTSTLWQQDLKPEPSIEERYDVSTGVRRRGPYKLDTTNLVAGSSLPSFTPIAADLMQKTAQVAIRVEVYEKFTTGTNTTLKIKKNSLAYVYALGRRFAGCDLSEVNDFLKFIPFLFTVKKSRAQRYTERHTGPLQVHCRPVQAPSQ